MAPQEARCKLKPGVGWRHPPSVVKRNTLAPFLGVPCDPSGPEGNGAALEAAPQKTDTDGP